MKLLVTGGGLVGAALSRRLVDDGHDVTVFDVAPPPDGAASRLIEGDLRDPDAVADAVKGHDGVFHTAALHPGAAGADTFASGDYMSVNVIGTYNVLEAAVAAGVGRLVHCSTLAVLDLGLALADPSHRPLRLDDEQIDARRRVPSNLYGLTKALGEHIVEFFHVRHGLDAVALRFGGIWELVRDIYPDQALEWASGMYGITTLSDVVQSQIAAMLRSGPLPRLTYSVVAHPAIDVDAAATRDDLRSALLMAYPQLACLSDPVPWCVVDTNQTERDLGMTITGTSEALLRELAS